MIPIHFLDFVEDSYQSNRNNRLNVIFYLAVSSVPLTIVARRYFFSNMQKFDDFGVSDFLYLEVVFIVRQKFICAAMIIGLITTQDVHV